MVYLGFVFFCKCFFILNIDVIFYIIQESLICLLFNLKVFYSLIIKNLLVKNIFFFVFCLRIFYEFLRVYKEVENKYDWLMFVFRVSFIVLFFFIILFYLLWLVIEFLVLKYEMFCQKEIMEEKFVERNWVCQ